MLGLGRFRCRLPNHLCRRRTRLLDAAADERAALEVGGDRVVEIAASAWGDRRVGNLAPDEHRRALFDKSLRRLAMVFGSAGSHLPYGFGIEQLAERAGFRKVEVLLHHAQRDTRSLRKTTRERHRFPVKVLI